MLQDAVEEEGSLLAEVLDRATIRKIVAAFNETDLAMDMNELKINVLAVQGLRLRIGKVVMEAQEKYRVCYPELILALTKAIEDVVRIAKNHYLKDGKL
jgi:NCAIR mutase (PurE)-related protein